MEKNLSSIESSFHVADALVCMNYEQEEIYNSIKELQETVKSFGTCPVLYKYSIETLTGSFGKDKIKSAFLFVKRVLTDFQTRSKNQKTNEQTLDSIVKRMRINIQHLKQANTDPSEDYLKSIEVCCYDNNEFLNYLKNLNLFVTSLIKSSYADSAEAELRLPVSVIGYAVDNGNFVKVDQNQKNINRYKYFEKYTLDDLISLTDHYIDLCQKLNVLHRCHDNVNRDIDKAIHQIDDVDRILKDNKTIQKKCMPAIQQINKTIGNSNIVLNGAALVMSNVKVMDIMLSDMWANVLTR